MNREPGASPQDNGPQGISEILEAVLPIIGPEAEEGRMALGDGPLPRTSGVYSLHASVVLLGCSSCVTQVASGAA